MSFQRLKKRKEKANDEGNMEDLFTACSDLAEWHRSKEEFDNALKEYKEAKTAAKAANNMINVAVAHRMIGEVYSSTNNYDLAVKHQLKYLELARSQGDSVEEQRALANLGHFYLIKADSFSNPNSSEKYISLEKAKKYCLLSLKACERLTNKREIVEMQARLYLNLGLIVEQQNQIEMATTYFKKAIHLCKSMDIWEFLYRSYISLASLFQHQDNHSQALEHFDKALEVAKRLPDRSLRICEILLLKADVLFDLPNFRGAKQCLLKAYKLNTTNRSEVEKKLRTVAAVNQAEEKLLSTPEYDLATKKSLYELLGDGCASMKSFTKALEYYYLMLETAKHMGETGEQLKPCYVSLSQSYKDNKQYDLAIKFFKEELSLYSNNPIEACKTYLNIAEVLEIKEAGVDEILDTYQEARRLAQAGKDHKYETCALESMVQVLKDNDRLSEARKMEAELENLKEKFGLPAPNSESEEEDNTPDIGADICIDELSDADLEDDSDNRVRTRKKCPATKFRRNEKGEFPLHTACINGNSNLVKKLLDQGHPVNVRDHCGWLPLHEACNHGRVDIVEMLLDHGATINDRGTEGCDGMTPLLDAAVCGQLDVMKLLMDRGASPVMRTNKGDTVLDCLQAWRQRYIKDENRDLDPEILSQYNSLINTLRAALKKAGYKSESNKRSPSPSPCSSNLSKTYRKHEDRIMPKSGISCSSRRSTEDNDFPARKGLGEREKIPKSVNSLRKSLDNVSSHDNTGAAQAYEDAIKALRRKPIPMPSSPSPPPADDRSAFVSDDDIVDDWLVDDLAPGCSRGIKRRRLNQFDGEPLRRPNRLTNPDHGGREFDTDRRNSFRPVSPVNIFSQSLDVSENNLLSQSEKSSLSQLADTEPVVEEQRRSSRVPSSAAVSTYQVPLSVFGVVRNPVPQQPQPEMFLPSSQSAPQPHTQLPLLSQAQMAPPSIRVRVEGKLLLIPLPTSTQEPLTIAWLAGEAAKRYYSFEGMEPKLNLTTDDGAMLAPQDPVTLLLSYREITGVVTSWKTHPITERYREACVELGVDADDYLERSLDISQASFSLNLKGCSLDAKLIDPIFRASAYQSFLQHLILSDNRLGDAGLQLLAKVIHKLPHLRELDLTCNGITYEGLNIFFHKAVELQACKRLEKLVLSHNRLGKNCITLLCQLLQVTISLTCLSLASVGITASSFVTAHHLPFENIEKLDVSHNALGRDGVRALLRGLAVKRVTSLSLAHTGEGVPSEVTDWLTQGDPCRLQTLDIAYCSDSHNTFKQLIKCLEKAVLLEHLEMTCPNVEDVSVMESLYGLRLRVLRLPGVVVSTIPSQPLLINNFSCLSLNPQPSQWAKRGPFGLLTNSTT